MKNNSIVFMQQHCLVVRQAYIITLPKYIVFVVHYPLSSAKKKKSTILFCI